MFSPRPKHIFWAAGTRPLPRRHPGTTSASSQHLRDLQCLAIFTASSLHFLPCAWHPAPALSHRLWSDPIYSPRWELLNCHEANLVHFIYLYIYWWGNVRKLSLIFPVWEPLKPTPSIWPSTAALVGLPSRPLRTCWKADLDQEWGKNSSQACWMEGKPAGAKQEAKRCTRRSIKMLCTSRDSNCFKSFWCSTPEHSRRRAARAILSVRPGPRQGTGHSTASRPLDSGIQHGVTSTYVGLRSRQTRSAHLFCFSRYGFKCFRRSRFYSCSTFYFCANHDRLCHDKNLVSPPTHPCQNLQIHTCWWFI